MSETTATADSHETASALWTPDHIRRAGMAAIRATLSPRPDGEPHIPDLLNELEPVVEANLNRHDAIRQFWVPSDFFPVDAKGKIINRAQDLPEDKPLLSPAAQAAMTLNLLTEDNLPAYHRTIAEQFGRDGAWGTWVNKWTAEEGRHAYAMRVFLDLTGAVDTNQLEEDRMHQMEQGYEAREKDPLHSLAYVTFQELATRISHKRTGEACEDEIADKMLNRIGDDENLHMLFYRNLVTAAFKIAPNQTMRAVADEVIGFEMPGANARGYQSKALRIARAGIYDKRVHQQRVVEPILSYWKIFSRGDFGPEGNQARDELAKYIEQLKADASRFEQKRDRGLLDKLIDRAVKAENTSSS